MSDHMTDWPLSRDERVCPHGVGHPEPGRPHHAGGLHGCDGCCTRIAHRVATATSTANPEAQREDARMAISQNGWPGLATSSTKLYTWTVPGADTRLRLRNGSAGFLLIHLATRFDRKVEALKEPLLDDWGYAYRPVRGYATLSNHASGTAVDLNATDHPLGSVDTFTNAEEATIRRLLERYDGCIRWGGDYRGRKDEMHFEINQSLAVCERLARRLADTKRGKQVLAVNPGQRAVIFS